jgi:hypothetical protein
MVRAVAIRIHHRPPGEVPLDQQIGCMRSRIRGQNDAAPSNEVTRR